VAQSEQPLPRFGHDQLFKQLLRAFFPDFLLLFAPQTVADLDLSTVRFRDTEAFTDIPHGERRVADLVAQVATRAGSDELILVHVEVQREREVQFARRMLQYYTFLRQRDDLPVWPIALVLYPAQEGIKLEVYEETVLGQTILSFRYLQISLPRLEAEEYVQGPSVLGAALATVMHLPRRRAAQIALHVACLRRVRLAQEGGEIDEARAFMLVNLIATYLPLTAEERGRVQVELRAEGDATMEATELTWADQIFERGLQQGVQQGLQQAILRVLVRRFGDSSSSVVERLAGVHDPPQLEALLDAAMFATSLDEFARQLP
jgi:hypothetical protein